MTKQEIFDKVATHLLKQGRKSIDVRQAGRHYSLNECVYRAPDGAMCAAGCLIKDEFYSRDLEYKSVLSPSVTQVLKLSGVDMDEHDEMVKHLQEIHDDYSVTEWADELLKATKFFDVTMPAVEKQCT